MSMLTVPVSADSRDRVIRPYDVLASRGIDGRGFRAESQTQDVTGHRDFDVQLAEHALTLTVDGSPTRVEASIDGGPVQRFLVRPGQVTLLPAGQRIRGFADGVGTRAEVRLYLTQEALISALGMEIEPSRIALVTAMELRNPSIAHSIAALGREVERPGPLGRLYTDSLAAIVITELVRCHSTYRIAPKRSEPVALGRLGRITEYIDAHIDEDLSLSTLAAKAGLSAATLAREFRRAMRESVHQYVLRRRVENAAALLAATEEPIADIALASGFSSQAHLTSAFRRFSATTPGVYRRELR
jgi:AraC family transcriptional regulator